MTTVKRLLCLILPVLFLCGCRASITEGTEFTLCGVVTDHAIGTVEEKPYRLGEEARPYITVETENGEIWMFWQARGYDWADTWPGDTVEIRGGTESGSGLTVAVEVTVLEKGALHLEWEERNAQKNESHE